SPPLLHSPSCVLPSIPLSSFSPPPPPPEISTLSLTTLFRSSPGAVLVLPRTLTCIAESWNLLAGKKIFSQATQKILTWIIPRHRSEEHTSELQSRFDLVCRLLLEKKKNKKAK